MLALVAKGLILYTFTLVLWRLLRRFIVKTDLHNVPGPQSTSFLKGNFNQLFNLKGWNFHRDMVKDFGKIVGVNGPFGSRLLYVFDIKALHQIIVKDQHIYEETTAFTVSNGLLFGDGLIACGGQKHRKQRKMLNPVFSVAHVRVMLPSFYEVANRLRKVIHSKVANGPCEVDMLHWTTRAALELIGQSGLGHSFDPLTEGVVPSAYCQACTELIPVSFTLAFHREYLLPTLIKIGSPKFRRFVVDHLPWKNVRKLRDLVDTMNETTNNIFLQKKRALEKEETESGSDIMSIIMKTNMRASEEDRLTDKEVLGQMSSFTFAATDTTANAIARILHTLVLFPDEQRRLHLESKEAWETYGDEVPYDTIVSLPYLDAVCRETLRLYPPVATILRTARQDAVLPLSTPIRGIDGREMHSIVVPSDTNILISILSANRDSSLWGPDSYEWKPERWLKPLPRELIEAPTPGVYSHLMTFLGGGRACIGFKFADLEMKVFLFTLLSRFRLSAPDKEIIWEMSAIATPTVKGASGKPQLPLIVELIK